MRDIGNPGTDIHSCDTLESDRLEIDTLETDIRESDTQWNSDQVTGKLVFGTPEIGIRHSCGSLLHLGRLGARVEKVSVK